MISDEELEKKAKEASTGTVIQKNMNPFDLYQGAYKAGYREAETDKEHLKNQLEQKELELERVETERDKLLDEISELQTERDELIAKKDEQDYFYEVIRNTPLGNVTMGRYRNKENAEDKMYDWNSTANKMDEACIVTARFDD